MEYEAFFLIGAVLLLVLDLFTLINVKRNKKQRARYGFYAATFSFGLVLLSYVLLLRAFLDNEFSLMQVYSYSSAGLPLLSKIYASWGGAGGSMLFLTFLLSIFYFALRGRARILLKSEECDRRSGTSYTIGIREALALDR